MCVQLFWCIPPLGVLLLLVLNGKKFFKKGSILFIISVLPITFLTYNKYKRHNEEAMRYVGTYQLTEYTEDSKAILKLNKDYSYTVSIQNNMLEQGEWEYDSGGDYWIVDIGDYGQLGSGKYQYSISVNGFTHHEDSK